MVYKFLVQRMILKPLQYLSIPTLQQYVLNCPLWTLCCYPPTYRQKKPPVIYHGQVHAALQKLKTSKSGHPNDLPVKLIKEFAIELTELLTHIFNKCILDGIFPESWKTAAITPIPKEKTVNSLDQLRPISLTPNFCQSFFNHSLPSGLLMILQNISTKNSLEMSKGLPLFII